MTESLAVPVDTAAHQPEAWTARMHRIASQGSQQCQLKGTVHSAICTITGSPDELVVNLACTAKSEEHVSELMQYVNDTLLPQMEKSLGVQFEVRNLQFAVAGKECLVAVPDHLDEVTNPTSWLDQPFAAPSQTYTAGLENGANESRTDLSMA